MTVSNLSDTLRAKTRKTLDQLRVELLAQRNGGGHWVGELSPSSLSTATAVSAMSAIVLHQASAAGCDDDTEPLREFIVRGIEYLKAQQNVDGGFGDTDRSHSNIATSYLALAASSLARESAGRSLEPSQLQRLQSYISSSGEIEGLKRRYGKDKTFVVPILTNLAIAGLVKWDQVAALPFEAAVFPQSMYRFLGMPVVSYAVPALVAIGQARHFHGRRSFFPLRMIRAAAINKTMKVLRQMQPPSGGYLEATPLTSFVVMSLAVTRRGDCEVSRQGLRFLKESMSDDGSWPIDTNLATWVTSLAIHALASDPDDDGAWCSESLTRWHLGCQHLQRHPFTGAEPGGWGWSDLSGAVPDSDDTPAAILALSQIRRRVDDKTKIRIDEAIRRGRQWLLKLQNRNGGWPTFCRGWGKLPFDRSSTDLTGHAIRALHCAIPAGPRLESGHGKHSIETISPVSRAIERSTRAARAFLLKEQCDDGSWLPLWFGNQDRADETNPVYGTARVLLAASDVGLDKDSQDRGCHYLLSCQNGDGGWGGGPSVRCWLESSGFSANSLPTSPPDAINGGNEAISSVEETALAVEALSTILLAQRNFSPSSGVEVGREHQQISEHDKSFASGGKDARRVAIIRGIEFLLKSVDDGRHRVPWPIGFYFAKLWYHERLYPLIFTVAALGKYLQATAEDDNFDWPR